MVTCRRNGHGADGCRAADSVTMLSSRPRANVRHDRELVTEVLQHRCLEWRVVADDHEDVDVAAQRVEAAECERAVHVGQHPAAAERRSTDPVDARDALPHGP